MIAEGEPDGELVKRGLAITRAAHDRHAPEKRNPYNEIECGDHYARAMASFGVLLSSCGYEYHGPKGYLGMVPRINPANFKAPFTAAEGWGTLAQTRDEDTQINTVQLKWGQLQLNTFAFEITEDFFPEKWQYEPRRKSAKKVNVNAYVNGKFTSVKTKRDGVRIVVTFGEPIQLTAGDRLEIFAKR